MTGTRKLLYSALAVAWLVACEPQGQSFAPPPAPQAVSIQGDPVRLPNQKDSLKFAVIGDAGTGDSAQSRVARVMDAYRGQFPFTFALMAGDNLYGAEKPSDYQEKFEAPYRGLLESGVKFYATLGNHDDPSQSHYKLFNMGGERYYTFKPADSVRIFLLDSNYMDPAQVDWLTKELEASNSPWKIAVFHHPLYSTAGRHGSDLELRQVLEPLFVKHGVDVVFSGHDHVYARVKPQKGITYFVVGNSAKLRKGDLKPSELTAVGYDRGYSFLLAEIAGDHMYFQTFNEQSKTVDQGDIRERDSLVQAAGAP